MIYTDITAYIREQAQVSSSNFSDNALLKYVNPSYHKIENAIITKVDPDFFYSVFDADLESGVNEYPSQINTATVDGFKKIFKVEVKWASTDTNYSLLKDNSIKNYNYSEDYIKSNLPKEQGFWEYKRGNFFIYPTPLNTVTNGIKIYVTKSLKDLTTTAVETDIFPGQSILRQFHHIIALGAIPAVLRGKGLAKNATEILEAKAEFRDELNEMISFLSDIYAEPIECETPDGSYYKY